MKPLKHLHTINKHRRLVRKYCFRLGLYWQGLTHDLSKYSPAEFWLGAKYYLGYRSPNDGERTEKGYSTAWMHHKGRNKHHPEYWTDFSKEKGDAFAPVRMPIKYVAEMFCDRLAACKIYHGENYTNADPYNYYQRSVKKIIVHPETSTVIEKMLEVLKDNGEDAAFKYVREVLKDGTI